MYAKMEKNERVRRDLRIRYMIMGKTYKTNRGLLRYILLSIVTCGIYSIVFWYCLADDINTIATRRDGKKTMNYIVMCLLSAVTCGIVPLVWFHRISGRIGDEARARGVNTEFGASTFWLWYILGSMIVVGPFIYMHKLCQAMNGICENYNQNGI